jgi:hypothetical protein
MEFYTRSVPRSYKEDNLGDQVSSVREAVKKRDRRKEFCTRVCEEKFSWKGAAIQRELEPGGRGIVIVGAVTRKRLLTD